MACVGGSNDAEQTSEKAKILCNPCEHAGLGREAVSYCKHCEEYMCTPCSTIHGSFRLSRNHILESIPGLPSAGQVDARKCFPSYCADQKDKLMELFCEEHDAIFCDSCKLTKHRKCEVMSVHDMATAATCRQQLTAALDAMVDLKARLENIKTDRENSIDALKRMEMSCVAEIKAFKAKVIEMVERLEREILADVNKVIDTELGLLRGHVGTCDVLLRQVHTDVNDAVEAKSAAHGLSSVFLANKLRTTRPSTALTITDIQTESYRADIKYIPTPSLADILTRVDRLGELQVTPPKSISHSICLVSAPTSYTDMHVDSVMKTNVPSTSTSTPRCITGSTILPDGQAILVDNSNKQVIFLDKMLSLKSTLSLPSQPWDVAVDGTDDVIVTMPDSKKLQWIGVGSTLLAGRTITTDLSCYGVAVHAREIYTSVRSGVNWCDVGHVLVLDRHGAVTRRVGLDADGKDMFSHPYYITVNRRGSVYVSDYQQNRITCFTATGDVMYDVRNNNMCQPRGMSLDENDNLLVCSEDTNSIHVIKKDGSYHRVFASLNDGLVKPCSVSYRRCDQPLIVTMKKPPGCVAYTLKY